MSRELVLLRLEGKRAGVQVAGRIDGPRQNSTVHVLLERDDSKRWQQYLSTSTAVTDAKFHIPVHRPGLYWIIATEETDWSYRRGACLLKVDDLGNYSLRPVPDTKVGRKWGGPTATHACKNDIVPLTVYRGKKTFRIQK